MAEEAYSRELPPAVEITETEWKSRKLSAYGFFSWLIDALLVACMFAAMGGISISIIPSLSSPGQAQFWFTAEMILFIISMKKIFVLRDPLNHYQTLVIRQ